MMTSATELELIAAEYAKVNAIEPVDYNHFLLGWQAARAHPLEFEPTPTAYLIEAAMAEDWLAWSPPGNRGHYLQAIPLHKKVSR